MASLLGAAAGSPRGRVRRLSSREFGARSPSGSAPVAPLGARSPSGRGHSSRAARRYSRDRQSSSPPSRSQLSSSISGLDGLDLSALPAPEPGCFDEGADGEEEDDEEASTDCDDDSHRVTTVCACRKFDEARLPELLGARLGRECRWKHGKESIYVPFSPLLAAEPGRRVAASAAPPPRGAASRSSPSGLARLQEPMLAGALEEDASCSSTAKAPPQDPGRCVIFFQYGVVVMWDLTPQEEQGILENIVDQVAIQRLSDSAVEKDKLEVKFHPGDRFSMRDDTVHLPKRLQRHAGAILSIAHALAQSTKLCVFEEQSSDLVKSTEHLPHELATKGRVSLSKNDLFKLVGRLFVHKSEVDKLSSVLNTPEYFWHAPDALQATYKEVCTYLEVEERIDAINSHLEVTQGMLDMLQSRHDASHGVFLEWIVIILICFEAVLGVLEFCGTIGLIPPVAGGQSMASRVLHIWRASSGHEPPAAGCGC